MNISWYVPPQKTPGAKWKLKKKSIHPPIRYPIFKFLPNRQFDSDAFVVGIDIFHPCCFLGMDAILRDILQIKTWRDSKRWPPRSNRFFHAKIRECDVRRPRVSISRSRRDPSNTKRFANSRSNIVPKSNTHPRSHPITRDAIVPDDPLPPNSKTAVPPETDHPLAEKKGGCVFNKNNKQEIINIRICQWNNSKRNGIQVLQVERNPVSFMNVPKIVSNFPTARHAGRVSGWLIIWRTWRDIHFKITSVNL